MKGFMDYFYNLVNISSSGGDEKHEEATFEDKGAAQTADNIMNTNKKFIEENLINEKDDSDSGSYDSENETPKNSGKSGKAGNTLSREHLNWRTKVNRFLYFCLNGGLCDYAFSFKDISKELLKKIELRDELFKIMNLINLETLSTLKEEEDHTSALVLDMRSINETLKLNFNEEAVCGMIRTGTLFKLSSDDLGPCFLFLKLLLKKEYASNKILCIFFCLLFFFFNACLLNVYVVL